MWNLIKAQNYQLKRDNGILYILLAGGTVLVLMIADLMRMHSFEEITGGLYAVSMGGSLQIVLGMLVIFLTARIVGWDYNDKTINYEVLSGHSRGQIFMSRMAVSLAWSLAVTAAAIFLPLLVFGIFNGWGNIADMGGVLARYVLVLFPILRLSCEITLLAVLVKNCFLTMVLGDILFALLWSLVTTTQLAAEFTVTTQLSSMNMQLLFCLDKYHFDYIDGADVVVYETALEPELILGTVAVSVAVGLVCLLIGYGYFKKSDMN